jgi:hypothetical protein
LQQLDTDWASRAIGIDFGKEGSQVRVVIAIATKERVQVAIFITNGREIVKGRFVSHGDDGLGRVLGWMMDVG